MLYAIENDTQVFDYAEIQRLLIAEHGASAAEAAQLTDILHDEGWGGYEDQLNEDADTILAHRLEWYRSERA